ncbi:geranylgeranyl pyrophosphate synthetase [Diaporthe amygdali]|uniref:geranylgeranyl pyrophosphate synthetase n=1 Tax=Phomopsis amygdali TaxID=1214568 RepID=UPI0022FEDF0F|nr:geranylgeranyl pyrophosphate synthetase [Diaporthe amygdali]KAJ0114996.1 geranylgeranyl pyrophosphate synthetase [Diaporthe amygdali]
MARYRGGPRGQPLPAPWIESSSSSDRETTDDYEDQQEMNTLQTRTVIPDSDDPGSNPSDDQGDLADQSESQSDSEIDDDEEMLEDEEGDVMTPGDDYDMDESIEVGIYGGFSPRVHGGDTIENDREERPKRQRSLSIPIHYESLFTTGKPIFEPEPLSIAYGWMAKGTSEHIEDLHLSGIPFCHREVRSKIRIEMLGEYTWIEVTPSQEETYEKYPAIYVPGNTRTWRNLKIGTSLDQDDIRCKISKEIRDDNLTRQPRYPYEPTFRALEQTQKFHSFKEIDIVTDAATLAQLLAFIMGASSARPVKEPFRLELTSVRNTLFILPSQKPGSGYAGPAPKKVYQDTEAAVPAWCADVVGHISTRVPKLPYSGGHYRVVRYRFGNVVLAVRVKVDFVYEHRKDSKRTNVDPLREIQPDFMPKLETDVAQVWKTTVKRQGLGTKPAGAGVASVRYIWQEPKDKMRALLPQLWFSRTPFVIDCEVTYPDLEVQAASLINSREYYTSFENGHQSSLRRLAGLLKHLQQRTRELDGNIVLIADPVQVCFVLLKPVIKRPALPEDLALKFWGPDTEEEARKKQAAEMERDSTPEEEQSDLTDLSKTPSLPRGSDLAHIGMSQPSKSQSNVEATSSYMTGGSPTRADRQRAQGIDPIKMVVDWKKSVKKRAFEGDGTGHKSDTENMMDHDKAKSFDGYQSSGDSIMVGESAHEPGFDGADNVLNKLALQMNASEQLENGGGSQREKALQGPKPIDQITSMFRDSEVEVVRGQHSLLMVDRHLMKRTDASDDDVFFPSAPTPPGPSEYDKP